jgi:hypothetical protein
MQLFTVALAFSSRISLFNKVCWQQKREKKKRKSISLGGKLNMLWDVARHEGFCISLVKQYGLSL